MAFGVISNFFLNPCTKVSNGYSKYFKYCADLYQCIDSLEEDLHKLFAQYLNYIWNISY